MNHDDLRLVLLVGKRLGFADAADMVPGGDPATSYTERVIADVRATLGRLDDLDPQAREIITEALDAAA